MQGENRIISGKLEREIDRDLPKGQENVEGVVG